VARLAPPDLAAVEVHGPVSRQEVARLCQAAEVFVLARYREPYGAVYGEATDADDDRRCRVLRTSSREKVASRLTQPRRAGPATPTGSETGS
jgi:hypothetical protein